MNRQKDSTSATRWQPVATVLKRTLMELHLRGAIPQSKVKAIFARFPELRSA